MNTVVRSIFRLGQDWSVLILIGALLQGCNRHDGPQTPPEPPATVVSRGEPSGWQSDDSVHDAFVTLEDPAATDPVDDPASDGWNSEAVHLETSTQLKHLGTWLTAADEHDLSQLAKLFVSDARSSPLLPTATTEVFRDDVYRVERMTLGTALDDAGASQSAIECVQALRSTLTSLRDLQFKFKSIRVQLEDDTHVMTQEYVHFSGRSATGAYEQNSTWIVHWSRVATSEQLQIERIELTDFERVTTATEAGHGQFTDATLSLLGHDTSYRRFCLQGIDHWRERLESRNAIYNFGYHGLSIADVNGDDLPDLYVCQTGGLPNHLFIQHADGTLHDIAPQAGLDYLDNTRAALFVDLDNDDDQDMVLALTTGLLFLSNDGQANFTLRARIPSVRQAFGLAAADYDEDGNVDIYVCVYYGRTDKATELPYPIPYFDARNGGPNVLIRNEGGFQFRDVTAATGLDKDNNQYSFAAAWEDYDDDGDIDLVVVNDFGPNNLYQNHQGRFQDVAAASGLSDRAFGMSATFGDYDQNGLMDLYVSNMFSSAGNRITFQPQFKMETSDDVREKFQFLARGNSLFQNLGSGRFRDTSIDMNVTVGRWSWSSLFADINNDGLEDLLVTNGFLTGESTNDL